MTLLPRHPVTRVIALIWLLACLAFLMSTLTQSTLYADDRAALARLVPVYFLGFPAAHLGFAAIAKIKLALYLNGGFEPGLLAEGLYLWTLMVALGYVQWFIALPWIARVSARLCGRLLSGTGERRS